MDPQKCFEYMLEMRAARDWAAFNECRHDLIEWLRKGGFGPRVRYCYSPFAQSLASSADGREGTLVALTHTGDATIRWRNGRRSVVSVGELGEPAEAP